MIKTITHPVKLFNYLLFNYALLSVLIMPITADATMQEQVTVGGQPIASATGTCSETTDLDLVIQHMDLAKSDLLTRSSSKAENNLKQAYQELQNLKKEGSGAVTERITITHGPRLKDPEYFNTANAYYSPDMQDMRLLKMAESNLKAGNSQAACSELSAVRFPYVSANAQLTVDESAAEANHALMNLQVDEFDDAVDDVKDFTVNANTYASIVQE